MSENSDTVPLIIFILTIFTGSLWLWHAIIKRERESGAALFLLSWLLVILSALNGAGWFIQGVCTFLINSRSPVLIVSGIGSIMSLWLARKRMDIIFE